jgi:hypothetical protein
VVPPALPQFKAKKDSVRPPSSGSPANEFKDNKEITMVNISNYARRFTMYARTLTVILFDGGREVIDD